MKQGNFPARDRSLGYVTDLAKRWPPGSRLPSLNRLARMSGVSRATMWKSVQECVRAGTVVTRPGGGIFTPGITAAEPAADSSESMLHEGRKWQRTTAKLAEDIRMGVFKRGELLPPSGELQTRYRVSYPTVAKCLKVLVAQRQLITDRSRFRVPALATSPQRKAIVFVARAMTRLDVMPLPHLRTLECFSVLETECLNAGIQVIPLLFDYSGQELKVVNDATERLEASARDHTILGFALSTAGLGGLDFETLFSRIRRIGQPLAVLDEDRMLVDRLPPMPALRLYTLEDDLQAGLNVGRFLLSLGHRAIGYITPFHGTEWAQARYDGLLRSCEQANVPARVVRFSTEVSYESRPNEDTLLPACMLALETLRLHANPPEIREAFQGRPPGLWHALTAVVNRNWMQQILPATLEQAAERKDITAWVAPNDTVAVHCLHFLRERGINVPRDVSVVGFDDSLSARLQSLTSYSFGVYSATQAMLTSMLHPPRTPSTGERVQTVSGFIHERGSTAPPLVHSVK